MRKKIKLSVAPHSTGWAKQDLVERLGFWTIRRSKGPLFGWNSFDWSSQVELGRASCSWVEQTDQKATDFHVTVVANMGSSRNLSRYFLIIYTPSNRPMHHDQASKQALSSTHGALKSHQNSNNLLPRWWNLNTKNIQNHKNESPKKQKPLKIDF